ncbi:hypothetical protein BGAL_0224g00180 [Botrytis galanthina]|uniref:Uncharacterized protein n=1 Tax=Botrytis galanthina TaxID=278940 RepID=A0A4V4HUC3_9HELO|nr:hypothetical protein BGAL_0224g00180 [Botrytis galanthina]
MLGSITPSRYVGKGQLTRLAVPLHFQACQVFTSEIILAIPRTRAQMMHAVVRVGTVTTAALTVAMKTLPMTSAGAILMLERNAVSMRVR